MTLSSEFEIVAAQTDADFVAAGTLGVRLVRFHASLDPTRFSTIDGGENDYARILKEQAAEANVAVLIARRPGQNAPLGYVYGEFEERSINGASTSTAHLHELYVDDSARHSGVGKALIDAFLKRMKSLGAPRVVLLVATKNESARALFESTGFTTTMCEMMYEIA